MKKIWLIIPSIMLLLAGTLAKAHDYVTTVANAKPAVITLEVNNKFRWKKTKQQKQAEKLANQHPDLFDKKTNKRTSKSHGSGFLISKDGRMLTAAHVVNDPSAITVKLSNGLKSKASVIRVDKAKDVALLQIKDVDKLDGLTPLSISSEVINEGQPVLVIGGAFGLPVSTSSGIVSAIGVKLSKRHKHSVLLTDAATNPGSSGGPLLDENGLVIGVISKIYSKTGTFSGTAVALPANELSTFLSE